MTITAIPCPRPPEPPSPHPFPLFASVAPVIASVAIWAVTQSPFALVFALLGPVVAIAGLGDARRQGRRTTRQEWSRFECEVVAAIHDVDAAHERERADLHRLAPSPAAILAAAQHDPERWRRRPGEELPVTLGVGQVASALKLGPFAAVPAGRPEPAIEELRSRAAVLDGAPIIVDARLGVGLCGPASMTLPALGALLVQLANALSPDAVELHAVPAGSRVPGWVTALPQWSARQAGEFTQADDPTKADATFEPTALEFRSTADGERIVVATAGNERDLPRECRVVLRLDGAGRARILRHPENRGPEFSPGFVSARQVELFAEALAFARDALGSKGPAARRLPDRVLFAELPHAAGTGAPLAACLGVGPTGPAIVDLVSDGPHAVVGGTTGSGKSELLVTWVLAMAATRGPQEVNFLLVDFKGGAAFAPLRDLPHVVGTITDLDGAAGSERALQSLRAELRYREAVLAESDARSIDEVATVSKDADGRRLARLVIVVDEFATLTAGSPELHELFADLASRGRSLGIHLILCTQRPAGSVRDAVLANCALRISLRVNNRADSVAVVGEPDAADLPKHPVGRAIVARADGTALVQFAVADAADIAVAAERWMTGQGGRTPPVRRPWLDPLPTRLAPEELASAWHSSGHGIAFGLIDLPEEQRRAVAVYDPPEHGNLLVIGGRRSGKSSAIAAIAAGAPEVRRVPESVEGAWDIVMGTLECLRAGAGIEGLLLLDDVDILLGRMPPDYRAAFVDAITALHREGPAAGLHLVSTCTSAVGSLTGLCEARLVLRMSDRQEYAMAAGTTTGFEPALPPGGGTWNGSRVQIVHIADGSGAAPPTLPDQPPTEGTAVTLTELCRTGLVVVTSTPAPLAGRLTELLGAVARVTLLADRAATPELSVEDAGAGAGIVVGDPDDWTAAWGILGSLRSRVPILFHACSLAEYRALSRQRELPPPITSPRDTAWLLHPDARVERVRLP